MFCGCTMDLPSYTPVLHRGLREKIAWPSVETKSSEFLSFTTRSLLYKLKNNQLKINPPSGAIILNESRLGHHIYVRFGKTDQCLAMDSLYTDVLHSCHLAYIYF